MNKNDIIEFLGEDWTRVLSLIKGALHSDIKLLNDTNDNILLHSGKMLRPMLSLLMAKACGGADLSDSASLAAAVELLHNATLLHDDVADDSMERRGVPTVNSKLGPQAAVLVGDFWLARAVEMVLTTSKVGTNVLKLYSKTLTDLAEGEMLQLEKAAQANTTEADYFRIIYCKTASLFETSCLTAAISVGADPLYYEAARSYAKSAGIAFQIKDDILDYAGDAALGKPVGIDLREQKITLPLLCAMKGRPEEEEIRRMVREIHSHPEYCDQVRDFVVSAGGVEAASRRLDNYIEMAVTALDVLPDTKAKEYLAELVRFNAFRSI